MTDAVRLEIRPGDAALLRDLRGLRAPTTAHEHLIRFYGALAVPAQSLSVMERLARAPSPFAVEMALRDVALLAPHAARKHALRWAMAAVVRLAALRGHVYHGGYARAWALNILGGEHVA